MNTFFRLLAFVTVICLVGTSDAKSARQGASTMKNIEVVVHRGANYLAPENTVPSALKALEHGATWVELDVRKSKAFYIICMMKLWTGQPTDMDLSSWLLPLR